jgi:hypothetical protein
MLMFESGERRNRKIEEIRTITVFKVGNKVMCKTVPYMEKNNNKFDPIFEGSFRITSCYEGK